MAKFDGNEKNIWMGKKNYLILSADYLKVNKWYVDTSFSVHPDSNIHTRTIITMGQGAVQVVSIKQKLKTRSSTQAELVAVDDATVYILRTLLFI